MSSKFCMLSGAVAGSLVGTSQRTAVKRSNKLITCNLRASLEVTSSESCRKPSAYLLFNFITQQSARQFAQRDERLLEELFPQQLSREPRTLMAPEEAPKSAAL